MKFVINTSFDPHFCALFDAQNKLVAQTNWMIPREDGQQVWAFLKVHLPTDSKLSFIGGVSGPGSFSSLRVGGAILNALAFKFGLPIHQARADKVIKDFLESENLADIPFLLNSFSDRVFKVENETLMPVDFSTLDTGTAYITAWLPDIKAAPLKEAVSVNPNGPLHTMLDTLEKTNPQKGFVPDYEYPAIQT